MTESDIIADGQETALLEARGYHTTPRMECLQVRIRQEWPPLTWALNIETDRDAVWTITDIELWSTKLLADDVQLTDLDKETREWVDTELDLWIERDRSRTKFGDVVRKFQGELKRGHV